MLSVCVYLYLKSYISTNMQIKDKKYKGKVSELEVLMQFDYVNMLELLLNKKSQLQWVLETFNEIAPRRVPGPLQSMRCAITKNCL